MRRSIAALALAGATSLGIGLVAGLSHVSGGYVPPKVYHPPAMDIAALMRVATIKDHERLPQGWPPNVMANAKAVKTVSYRLDPTIKKPEAFAPKKRKAKRRRGRR